MRLNYHYRARRRRRTRRGTLVLLLLLLSIFLVSCVAGSNPLWIRGIFGIDFANYREEEILVVHPTDGELSDELCDMVEILTLGDLTLEPFSSTSQAVKLYRDAILNDMLRDNYLAYGGYGASLSNGGAASGPVLSMLIPREDFENAVYRYFGGTTVRHRDGELFRYLRRECGYTAPIQARDPSATVLVERIEETEHTYRMSFRLVSGEEISDSYFAVLMKREDSSCYFYLLEKQ